MELEKEQTDAALDAVDTSSVDALGAVQVEQESLRQLIERARAKRDAVSPTVYQRVVEDYEARARGLEDRARPLREQARAQLAALCVLHARFKKTLEDSKTAQQEVEFRHELGELAAEEFEAKIEDAGAQVTECQRVFDRADAVRLRFVAVLPAGSEPVPEPEPENPPPPPPVAAPLALPPELSTASLPGLVPDEDQTPGADESSGQTMVMPREAEGGDEDQDEGTFKTVSVSVPRLVEIRDGRETLSHALLAVTTIGRTPDNQIALDTLETSRRHARIEPCEGGFMLRDLGSGNGTYVNDTRINECILKEGDQVRIGGRSFVFHKD